MLLFVRRDTTTPMPRRRPAAAEKREPPDRRRRCGWAVGDLMVEYHDREWGAPLHGDRALFELLVLEGAQAGLSWLTVLRKRERYRVAFDGFDPAAIARYTSRNVQALLRDEGLIRNRQKLTSVVDNARALLRVREEFGSFDDYIWRFVGGRPRRNRWRTMAEIPARSAASDAMSADLKARGFRFVGSVICYAFMQASGMVNDHLTSCFRYRQIA
jgi:DNA-3-methyladenine glycosylase I